MRIIKKETDYAIRAVIYIYEKGGFATAKDIYSDIKASKPFIRKILQTLAKAGILESEKGRSGGFSLKKRFEDITLSMLVEPFSKRMREGTCPFKTRLCSVFRRCALKNRIYEIETEIFSIMDKTFIKDLWRLEKT